MKVLKTGLIQCLKNDFIFCHSDHREESDFHTFDLDSSPCHGGYAQNDRKSIKHCI